MPVDKKEKIQQIPQIVIPQEKNISDSQVAITLLNMGGPRTNADVQDFQQRLFSDPLLIRFPLSSIFQKLFAWILSRLRTGETAKRYQLIGGGSPIFDSTQKQAQALQDELKRRGRMLSVSFTFNYSAPFAHETIRAIKNDGKKYILPLSLYPHYSKATTGSSLHYLKKALQKDYPDARLLKAPDYYLNKGYIRAFTARIQEAFTPEESLDDFYLLFSAHGLPLYFLTEGDPYPFQVAQTVSGILQELGREDQWSLSYQSAVGPLQWMKPSTEDMIAALARRGIKKILIVPISFVTDHIETLWEIDIQFREIAERLGVGDFRMSKALECHPEFISALANMVEKSLNNQAID